MADWCCFVQSLLWCEPHRSQLPLVGTPLSYGSDPLDRWRNPRTAGGPAAAAMQATEQQQRREWLDANQSDDLSRTLSEVL